MTRYSEVSYTYSGGSKVFTIPFSYLKTEHINVFIDDVEATDFEFNTASQIQVNDEITSGQVVKIVRTTPIDSRMVNFNDRSVLNAQQQNLDSNQLFNVVQEVYDRNDNFTVDIQTQVDTANTNASAAVSTANTANSKADTAVSTANAAETKADNAVSTANSASSVANTASTNATNAVNTANSASSTATAASNKVDEFAEDIETVIEAAEDIEQFHEAINTCNQKATQATTAATNANTSATTASQKVTEITNLITDFNNQKGQINGIAPLDANAKLPITHIPTGVELTSNKDVANGYCGLDELCKIPQANIPDLFTNKDLSNLSALGQAILDKKVEVEALLQQNGYAKFSWKENNVISSLIFIFLKESFNEINVPANSNATKILNLPITINANSLSWVAVANKNGIFCTTVSVTNSTVELRLNNATDTARAVSRVNLIAIAFEN